MKKLVFLLFFIFSNNLYGQTCNCLPIATSRDAKKSSTHIFTGTVRAKNKVAINQITSNYKEYFIEMLVHQVWKGPQVNKIAIRTPAGVNECEANLQIGQKYLVYAVGNTAPTVTFCSRTQIITSDQAKEDLFYLEKPEFVIE